MSFDGYKIASEKELLSKIRREALEEAAQLCESEADLSCCHESMVALYGMAQTIRAFAKKEK